MAVVKGPLFSLDASGTVAGAVVFGKWKGRNYVRRHAVPSNPKSVGQLSVRAMMKFLTQYWASLTSPQQTDWEERAAVTNVSPFNAFVGYNMKRWGNNDRPSKLDPAGMVNTAAVISGGTATVQSRALLIGVTVDTHNDNWGICIFRGDAADMGVTRGELVQVIPAEATATFTWLDSPLTANVIQYYRAYGFADDGVVGNALDDWSGTPSA